MKKVLTPFLQPGGEIVEYPRGNFLIITDLPSNIQRLMEIADLIDVQVFAGTRMEIYQPKVASAEELAQEMTKVMQSFAASAPQSDSFAAQFIPLPRINQLLVISHSEAAWTYAKRWLDRIDVVAEGPGRRIFIYPVENGKAEDLASVLNQALGQPSSGTRNSSQTLQTLHRSSSSSGIGTNQPGAMRNPAGSSPFGSPGVSGGGFPSAQAAVALPGQQPVAPPPSGVAPPQAPGAQRPPAAPGAQGTRPEEQLRIVADPATNSLVIYGTAQEFQNVKNILKELDIVPRQVLLDVLVAEVTLKNNESLGVDYEIMANRPASIFGQKFGSAGAIRSLGSLFPSNGQFGNGVTAIFGNGDIRALITALASDSRAKILSSPSVLATDNRPARIQVGSEEPIPTGTITAAVGNPTVSSSTTIQYRNTGRIVTIIPQVNSAGLVNLQILAEVSQRGANVIVGTDTFPAFDTRQAETTAVVQDGDTLAIGGIIADNRSHSRNGIPYLMDLPVIGRLFGTTTDDLTRTELIMLITPHVIRNREQGQQITEDFKKSLSTVRNELERMAKERAKLQQQPLQDNKPALPGPSGDQPPKPPAPAPAPTAAPGVSGAPVIPLKKIDLRSELYPGSFEVGSLWPANQVEAVYAAPDPLPQSRENSQTLEASQTQPVYALSVTQPNPTTVAPAVPKRVSTQAEVKPTYLWVVQVAAAARRQDAEAVAELLRHKGYDAYVMEAEVGGKIWHRVRVGQSLARADASKLQKTLQTAEKFESAYMVRR